ncbi:hypothetical protein CVT24_008569 [Panaeolus cyanescens]|uniref:Uncharacterized protein n=1 Tax=Panaeolus cyanescens TaxID=181874 RepID=A0A409VKR7_9AGAR|nr:hypothetical protein CVT24_008569 [Panaeolus cyanescens]
MPGPANSKKKAKAQNKKSKQKTTNAYTQTKEALPQHSQPTPCLTRNETAPDQGKKLLAEKDDIQTSSGHDEPVLHDTSIPVTYPTPLVQQIEANIPFEVRSTISIPTGSPLIPPIKGLTKAVEKALFEEPFIQDPGNGPRVRDTKAFMRSFFAQPPAWDDPLCAEFAQEEIFQMLRTVLPEDMALVLWYNKSRSQSRVCPACQRLYSVMDTLKSHVDDTSDNELTPQLLRERIISGLCSPMCFILACFDFPAAIKSAWGATSEEMDDITWELLNRPVVPLQPHQATAANLTSRSLGLLVRMTRMHDLGLTQLCFEPEDVAALLEAEQTLGTLNGGRVPTMTSQIDTRICI